MLLVALNKSLEASSVSLSFTSCTQSLRQTLLLYPSKYIQNPAISHHLDSHLHLCSSLTRLIRASQVLLVVKNQPAKGEDVRDAGSIPSSGKPLEEGMATHSSILAQRIPWTEEPGGLQSIGSQDRKSVV